LTYLFSLEENPTKYELVMISVKTPVGGGAIHSNASLEQQGEYEDTSVPFSCMLHIICAHINRISENCLVSGSIFSMIEGLNLETCVVGEGGGGMHNSEN